MLNFILIGVFCLFGLSFLLFLIIYYEEKKVIKKEKENRKPLVDSPEILFEEEVDSDNIEII
ncbi:MAG TPA: hypothetical protein IAB35_00035 [Candidatus Faecimonas gallistercoris]|nr:hypothetical protein [Candidatus Faecimonas gallistercoris]